MLKVEYGMLCWHVYVVEEHAPVISTNLTTQLTYKTKGKYLKRSIKGMTKCGLICSACPYIKEGQNIKTNKNSD